MHKSSNFVKTEQQIFIELSNCEDSLFDKLQYWWTNLRKKNKIILNKTKNIFF